MAKPEFKIATEEAQRALVGLAEKTKKPNPAYKIQFNVMTLLDGIEKKLQEVIESFGQKP